jgi:hypothetical protein
MFNPLDYPVIFLDTDYVAPSAWWQHTPFARLLIALTEPSLLVELGTHYGVSYFAFCQAVKSLALHTRCYAVDTWQGDEQAGFYGEEVFEQVQHYNNQVYSSFSRLLRMTFNEALGHFADGEIDLLHIDGYHTYEAVKQDYENWLPKMSARGVMVFHDINVREANFGVWQLWHELRDVFPHFEFLHEHGLGILAVGAEAAALLSPILSFSQDKHATIGQLFSQLGQRIVLQAELQKAQTEKRRAQARTSRIKHKFDQLLRDVHESYAQEIERARTHIQHLEHQLAAISQDRQTERTAYVEELERARSYMQQLEAELSAQLQHRQTERTAYVEELERARSHMQQLEAELAAQLRHRQTERTAYVEELERARSHMQQLEAELAAQLQHRQTERTAYVEELERARSYMQQIEQESNARARYLQQAEKELDDLRQVLTECQQTISALQERLLDSEMQAQAERTALTTRLAESEERCSELAADLAASEEKCAQLEARLAETQAMTDRLQRKLDAYRAMD